MRGCNLPILGKQPYGWKIKKKVNSYEFSTERCNNAMGIP